MRALVVGAGRMGSFHCRVLRDLGLDVTTVDPAPGVADFERIPAGRFDVVCVAAPIEHLADEAARWAGHGGYLLIEKPGAPTEAEARELASLLDGQRVAIGYVERFNPKVRAMKDMQRYVGPTAASFTRWNDRPSSRVDLDVGSHDRDLARFLGLTGRCPITFDARAGSSIRRREIRVDFPEDCTLLADLTAHDASPLHAQWHAFLSGREGYATPADAVAVFEALEIGALRVAA